jgi:hypothetical protein
MKKALFFLLLFQSLYSFSQTEKPASSLRTVQGYLSFIFPVVTFKGNEATTNFQNNTTIGFPFGINILYNDHFGFSFEITPSIVAQQPSKQSTSSKTTNILFDPGPMFRFKHSFTIISRLAFETSGRYGFTPVFNKVLVHTKAVNYFLAGSLPVRFGNNSPSSIGMNLQFGFTFK